jgi:hypothetical protein
LEVDLIVFSDKIWVWVTHVTQVVKAAKHNLGKYLSVIHVWLITVLLHEKAPDTVCKTLERMFPIDQSDVEGKILLRLSRHQRQQLFIRGLLIDELSVHEVKIQSLER